MRRLPTALVVVALAAALAPARALPADHGPQVVLALIDTGTNPYSAAFRDDSPLAQEYPGTYLPGYPPEDADSGARALHLTLNAPTLAAALEADKDEWEIVELLGTNQLWWVPGTKIVGLISMGRGGVDCKTLPPVPPVGGLVNIGCKDHVLRDDQGHGTMTSSRATGTPRSLGVGARVVMIEGLGTASMTWAANQPWIDLQSNSWGNLLPAVPTPLGPLPPPAGGGPNPFIEVAKKQMVLFASGNGAGFTHGFAPQPTYIESTGAPGIILVGAHDNGHVSAWSEAPAHVVADGYGGWTAKYDDVGPMRPDPIACCTSTAAPYAAGGAAAELLEARTILGDDGSVPRPPGVVAVLGPTGTKPASGPLRDGDLTLAEWRDLLLHTAQARPVEGRDDGLLHFLGGPSAPQNPQHGPGENPFCEGCWTLPIKWTEVPSDVPAYLSIGYGAINEFAVALAGRVLRGEAEMPARAAEDDFFAKDSQIRRAYHGQP